MSKSERLQILIGPANCRGEDPQMFFDPKREKEAKKVCETCIVRIDCLEMAKRKKFPIGIFGGKNAEERAEMKIKKAPKRPKP